jgi:hypothetical protein
MRSCELMRAGDTREAATKGTLSAPTWSSQQNRDVRVRTIRNFLPSLVACRVFRRASFKFENCQLGWLRDSRKLLKRKDFLVAGARYVPNRQFLSIPFRSELIQCAV